MTQTDIIQKLCETVDDHITDDKPFKKEWNESAKWLKILEEYMKDDKKFNSIFYHYDMAEGLYQGATNNYYYREGFLCGARLALEICGFENKNL